MEIFICIVKVLLVIDVAVVFFDIGNKYWYWKGYREGHKKGVDFGQKVERECTSYAFGEYFKQQEKLWRN